MILAYRYIRNKRRAARAAKEAEAEVPRSARPEHDENSSQTVHDEPSNIPSAPQRRSTAEALKWRIMLMAALFVPVIFETLDYTVVATAQVDIASHFHRLDLQSYIGTIYLLTSTVFLPLFASLADVWGRHWALQLSLLCFMVGSAISTGSQNMATMLAGRGVAGIGAAGMMAVIRIILSDSNSLDENNWQTTMLFLLYTIGYCVGPVIGGALTTVTFRWIFAINLPCCLVAMVLSFFILRGRTKGPQAAHTPLPSSSHPGTEPEKETFGQKALRIDWVGAFLFMGAGITLLLALNWGSSSTGWDSTRVIVCFVLSGVLYLAWIAWEYALERKSSAVSTGARERSRNPLMRTEPMIPLELFTSWNLCVAQLAIFVSGMVMIVMFYFIAIFFTIVSGLSGTEAGTQLLYFAPGMGAGAIISITLLRILRQPKVPIVLGGLLITVSLGLISYAMDINNKSYVKGFLIMAGTGVGMSIGPLAIHCRFSQPAERNAIVSALTLFSRSLGGTVGLAQCGAVLNAKVTSILSALVASGALPADASSTLSAGIADGLSSIQSIGELPPEVQSAVRDAFQQGSRWAFVSLVPWAGLSFVLTLFLSNIHEPEKGESGSLPAPATGAAQVKDKEVPGGDEEKRSTDDSGRLTVTGSGQVQSTQKGGI